MTMQPGPNQPEQNPNMHSNMPPGPITPGYGPQYPAFYAVKPPYLGITIVSFSFGLASVLLGLIVGLGIVLGIVAVVCGHIAMSQLARSVQPRSGKGLAIAGLIMGYFGIVFGAFWWLLTASFFTALNESFAN